MDPIKQLVRRTGTMVNAVDAWAIAFALIKAFGHTIPWWAWLMFGAKIVIVMRVATEELKEKKASD